MKWIMKLAQEKQIRNQNPINEGEKDQKQVPPSGDACHQDQTDSAAMEIY